MNTATADIAADPTQGLRHAKKVVGYMAIGVMPSEENALLAQEALHAAVADGQGEASTALRAVGAIKAGLAPKEEMCRDAMAEITALLDRVSETSRAELRQRFSAARG